MKSKKNIIFASKNKNTRQKKSRKKIYQIEQKGGAPALHIDAAKINEDTDANLLKQIEFFKNDTTNPSEERDLIKNEAHLKDDMARAHTYYSLNGYRIQEAKVPEPQDAHSEYKYMQECLKIYNELENSANFSKSYIVEFNTHSNLPFQTDEPTVYLPNNIVVCFLTPIMHLGTRKHTLFKNPKREDMDMLIGIYQNMFKYKQNLDDEALIFMNKKWHVVTNYFKHSSWYYPGQEVPNVEFMYSESENFNEAKDGRFEVTTVSLDTSKTIPSEIIKSSIEHMNKKQISEKKTYYETLKKYVRKYSIYPQTRRYILLITGCRNIPIQNIENEIETNFYKKLMDKEILYTIINRKLARPLDSEYTYLDYTKYTSGFGTLYKYFAYEPTYITKPIQKGYFNTINAGYNSWEKLSRLTKVYLDIYKEINERQLTPGEKNYIRYTSPSKTLLFILKIITKVNGIKGKIEEHQNLILNKNMILENFELRKHLFQALQKFSNYFIDITDAPIRESYKLDSIARFMFFRILMYNNTLEKIGPHLFHETGSHLQHLYITETIQSHMTQHIHKFSGMVQDVLNLYFTKCMPSSDFLKKFPKLTNIELFETDFSVGNNLTPDILKNVNELSMTSCIFPDFTKLGEFLEKFTNLLKLNIFKIKFITEPDILDFSCLQKNIRLQHFSLEGLFNSTILIVQSSIMQNLKITYITLTEYNIMINIPNLSSMDFNTNLTPKSFNFSNCTSLRYLKLNNTDGKNMFKQLQIKISGMYPNVFFYIEETDDLSEGAIIKNIENTYSVTLKSIHEIKLEQLDKILKNLKSAKIKETITFENVKIVDDDQSKISDLQTIIRELNIIIWFKECNCGTFEQSINQGDFISEMAGKRKPLIFK
jgi:hypothetical protein